MRQELTKLASFKVATALQILLSRYGHRKEPVRETILLVLSKLAVEYPSHCAWWIYHFHFFDDQAGSNTTNNKKYNSSKQAITRADFAKELIKKILAKSSSAGEQIMVCESIFGDLKKLSERPPTRANESSMDIPKSLGNVSSTNLVMPIQENLQPQLPPPNYKRNFHQKALVRTCEDISLANTMAQVNENGGYGSNEEMTDESADDLAQFPAFKKNPVMICSFL